MLLAKIKGKILFTENKKIVIESDYVYIIQAQGYVCQYESCLYFILKICSANVPHLHYES